MYKRCKELLEELEKEGKIKVWWDFKFPEKEELKLRLKDMLEEEVDEKYYLSDEKIKAISHWNSYQKPLENVLGKESIVPTLTARGAGEEHAGMVTYSDEFESTTNVQNILNNQGIDPRLDIMQDRWRQPSVIELNKNPKHQQDLIQHEEGICRTIPAGTHASTPHLLKTCVTNNLRIRKLTPLECWRLQGFDDEDYYRAKERLNNMFYKGKNKSNSQLYKQAGNSITVNVLEKIFKNLFKGE